MEEKEPDRNLFVSTYMTDWRKIAENSPILLFDGVCNLCNDSVQFVIRNDPKQQLYFAALQSDIGQDMLGQAGIDPAALSSLVLYDKGRYYTHSSAALRTASYLRLPWNILTIFRVVPPFVRNAIYNWIARNRYRWFGKKDQCMMPTPELKARFL